MNRFCLLLMTACLALTMSLWGCATLPKNYERQSSKVMQDTGNTRLGISATQLLGEKPETSGLFPLSDGLGALSARLELADASEKSLDLQYFIWHNDTTGRLLAYYLLKAADRGVRVRLLLDDYGAVSSDIGLLALDSHPKIEVRVFNPVGSRNLWWFEFVLKYGSLNRRMHNKAFIADNQAAIVGGRNIGNEYFQANPVVEFGDLDVLAMGPVVNEVSNAFDLYWNCQWAYPISVVSSEHLSKDALEKARKALEDHASSIKESEYEKARKTHLLEKLEQGSFRLFRGKATAVYDEPEKLSLKPGDQAKDLWPKLHPVVEAASSELVIVSPYYVPGKSGLEFTRKLRERGVQVTILTNSLASTDVFAVHAGYAPYRKDLIRMGVGLYEFKSHNPEKKSSMYLLKGSSQSRLHAKTFIVDRQIIFIGTLNLDPRSVIHNTEIGIVIECPELAGIMAQGILDILPENAYRLEFREGSSKLQWVSLNGGKEVILSKEPDSTFWRNMGVKVVSLFPVESEL